MGISSVARDEAVRLARWAIEWYIKGNQTPPPDLTDPLFDEERGVFVTIHQGDQLRGCVGRIEPSMALKDEIPDLALSAATRDPRFHPISSQEVDSIRIEISLLTPPEQVRDISEIQIGVHGLIIEKNDARGLLLPQVAIEEGWDRETFLTYACLKAGQPAHAWKDPETKVYRFTADVLSQ